MQLLLPRTTCVTQVKYIESFGLSSVCRGEVPSTDLEAQSTEVSLSKVPMIKFKHKEVQEVINTIHVDNLQEYEEEFTAEDGLTLLKQAVSSFYVCKALQEMSKTADFSGTNIFFTTFMATVERLCDMHVNTNNLDSLLESWNLRRV